MVRLLLVWAHAGAVPILPAEPHCPLRCSTSVLGFEIILDLLVLSGVSISHEPESVLSLS